MRFNFLHIVLLFVLMMTACEKEITVHLPTPEDAIVVEGYIENDLPPYVYLTKNSAYFGDFDVNDLGEYFVKGAKITVSNGKDSVELMEYSSDLISLLPDSQRVELSKFFGIPLDSNMHLPDISVYTIPLNSTFVGEIGKTYFLRIEIGGKVITSRTSIPNPVAFMSLRENPHPNPKNDTLIQIIGHIKDPDTLGNFYRYFTRKNSLPYYTKGIETVLDDIFANGKEFDIQVPYGWDRYAEDQEFDVNTFGYWHKGDTCYIKLSMIDKASYEFWKTLENELRNQGSPFGSIQKIRSNINGGLGIWNGMGSTMNIYYSKK
ncbi:MAG: DUF4249 domain-containing protein [Chitinophagales bacterium]|nr:DUF4249 domain-containing protein [Chitinophagales bacterium]